MSENILQKEITLSDENICILLDLLGKIQSRGLNLISHAGELKAIVELEAVLENASDLRYEKDYQSKIDESLNSKSDANLVKLDFRRILNKDGLFRSLSDQINFPTYAEFEWPELEKALNEFCDKDQIILLINKEKMPSQLKENFRILVQVIDRFNSQAKTQITVVG